MAAKSDSPSGYVLIDSKTNTKYSEKVYRSAAGIERSTAWRFGLVTEYVSVDHFNTYYAN